MPIDLIVGLAGAAIVAVVVNDVFQSVIVPRPASRWRPSALISRRGWQVTGTIGMRFRNAEKRENFFGVFAPALLVTLLIFWVTALVLGLGLVFFALRSNLKPAPENVWGAAYYAGTSLLTLGYGDITATTGLARALSLAAAAIGLGTFSVVTAFLFALFAAFQRREAFIVTMRERTGAPPSGVDFLERHIELGLQAEIGPTFRAAESWIADILETHLAYPTLAYFRSTHDYQSWVGTIGALLDASALIVTTVRTDQRGEAVLFNRLGRHLVSDLSNYFRIGDEFRATGIERAEFNAAYERLRAKGVPLIAEDAAWSAFAELRGTYAGELNAMARYFRIPPAQWIGDRSSIATRHR